MMSTEQNRLYYVHRAEQIVLCPQSRSVFILSTLENSELILQGRTERNMSK